MVCCLVCNFIFKELEFIKYFGLTFYFLFLKNKNTENAFKKNYFLSSHFHFTQNEVIGLNSKYLKTRFYCFQFLVRKIFSLNIKIEIQPNTFPLPFSIFNENKNKKQPIQHFLTIVIMYTRFPFPINLMNLQRTLLLRDELMITCLLQDNYRRTKSLKLGDLPNYK